MDNLMLMIFILETMTTNAKLMHYGLRGLVIMLVTAFAG